MSPEKLPYVTSKVQKGKTYWYFRRAQTYRRLPDPADPAFAAVYAALRDGKTLPLDEADRSWAALIANYQASPDWMRTKPRTKKDYERVFDWIIRALGKSKPTSFRQPDIIKVQEAQAFRRRFANYIVQVMGVLFRRAVRIGWMDTNPAKGVPMLAKPMDEDKLHKPWPDEAIEAFTAAAAPGSNSRTLFELELGLSQRTGDSVLFSMEMWNGEGFSMTQGKTGTALFLPATARLSAYIESLGRKAGPLVANPRTGEPLTYSGGYQAIRRVLEKIGRTDLTPHGLRYTVAAQLGAADGSDDEIMALTGHKSKGMAIYYAGQARQKAHARRAQLKREKGE